MDQVLTFKNDSDEGFSKRLFEYIGRTVRTNPPITQSALELKSRDVSLTDVYMVPYRVDAVFSTKVGVIHHERGSGTICIVDDNGTELREDLANILIARKGHLVPLGESGVNAGNIRFEMRVSEVRRAVQNKVRLKHTRTVRYVGGNNQSYSKECVPSTRDIWLDDPNEVLLPVTTAKYALSGVERSIELIDPVGTGVDVLQRVRCDACRGVDDLLLCSQCGKIVCRKDGFLGPKGHGSACSVCGETTCGNCGRLIRKILIFKKPLCSGCTTKVKETGKKVATWG